MSQASVVSQARVFWADVDVVHWLRSIVDQMENDNWKPDYIVGVARGGLIPAVMLSQHFKIPLHVLQVSFRDNQDPREMASGAKLPYTQGNILIVDDINDSGKTLNYINVINWELTGVFSASLPLHNIKYAVLLNKTSSDFPLVTYKGQELSDFPDTTWHVFPWEHWNG
jgi:uncharacterized protein